MEKNKIKKIAILGAESTGKTTLCMLLAKKYNTVFVNEHARDYFNKINIDGCNINDLINIAKQQLRLEKETIKKATRILFCDTSLITIKIWSQLEFNQVPKFIANQINKNNYDYYFILNNEVPWIEDPLRKNKFSRDLIFEMNITEVKKLTSNYLIIGNNKKELLKKITDLIH